MFAGGEGAEAGFESEGLGTAEGGKFEEERGVYVWKVLMEEANFLPEIKVGVGASAVGSESDAASLGQNGLPGMMFVAEEGMGAGAVDEGQLRMGGEVVDFFVVEIVAVDDEGV